MSMTLQLIIFFFQAEDGIRDIGVTGVQTCALPISVDFRNVIMILTSNLGSQFLGNASLDEKMKRDAVMGVVRGAFKPEFLNRLDEIVLFDALGTAELVKIVDINLQRLNARLAERRISVEATQAAKDWLALAGFDPVYGARPLRRLIQTAIEDQLARRVLAGELLEGSSVTFDVDAENSGLVVVAPQTEPV